MRCPRSTSNAPRPNQTRETTTSLASMPPASMPSNTPSAFRTAASAASKRPAARWRSANASNGAAGDIDDWAKDVLREEATASAMDDLREDVAASGFDDAVLGGPRGAVFPPGSAQLPTAALQLSRSSKSSSSPPTSGTMSSGSASAHHQSACSRPHHRYRRSCTADRDAPSREKIWWKPGSVRTFLRGTSPSGAPMYSALCASTTQGRCQTGNNRRGSTKGAKHGHSKRSSAVGLLAGSTANIATRTSKMRSSAGSGNPNMPHRSHNHSRKSPALLPKPSSSATMRFGSPPTKSAAWCNNDISKNTKPNANMSDE
mmetsp:Transcript_70562/g.204495  ORF Transcript_70562/g.204495 Transcript_70562/m.204495 type:complete len:316 (-) Transcript_70562:515-1462(-)